MLLAQGPTEEEYEALEQQVQELRGYIEELKVREPEIQRVIVEKEDEELKEIRERLKRNLADIEAKKG